MDNDYTHPTTNWFTTTDMIVDMTGRRFTPEESYYQASTPGWTDKISCFHIRTNPSPAVYTVSRNVSSAYELQPGGKAAAYRQSVFGLGVTAQNMTPGQSLANPGGRALQQHHGNEPAIGR